MCFLASKFHFIMVKTGNFAGLLFQQGTFYNLDTFYYSALICLANSHFLLCGLFGSVFSLQYLPFVKIVCFIEREHCSTESSTWMADLYMVAVPHSYKTQTDSLLSCRSFHSYFPWELLCAIYRLVVITQCKPRCRIRCADVSGREPYWYASCFFSVSSPVHLQQRWG